MVWTGEKKAYGTAAYAVLTASYLGLNSLLNLTNKWALGWFQFPLVMTTCHMAVSFLMLLPIMLAEPMRSKHRDSLGRQWKGFVLIGMFLGLNIALNNTALVNMTLTLNQVIRASIPVFTAILSIVFEYKVPTRGEGVSLCVLTAGVMMAVWQKTVAGTPMAITLCIIGTVCNAGMMSMSGKVLAEKVDVLQLTFYTAPVSCISILPALFVRELPRFLEYHQANSMDTYAIILSTSVIALTYNIVHSLMIQQTSAVTTTVIGEAKIIGLLILSYVLLGEKKVFTVNMTIGTVTAILGFCMFSHFKLQKIRASQQDSLLPESQPLDKKHQSGLSLVEEDGDGAIHNMQRGVQMHERR